MPVATSSKGVTPLRRLHLIRPFGPPSPQGEGFFLVPTNAAATRATLGAQGNSPPGLGTEEGRGEPGIAQPKISRDSAITQVPFRARRSQTGQPWEFPRATRRQLFAYFFWKKYDPFLVGTSRRVPQVGGTPPVTLPAASGTSKKEPHASACSPRTHRGITPA